MTPERFQQLVSGTLSVIPAEFHFFALKQAKRSHYSADYEEILSDLRDICEELKSSLENFRISL